MNFCLDTADWASGKATGIETYPIPTTYKSVHGVLWLLQKIHRLRATHQKEHPYWVTNGSINQKLMLTDQSAHTCQQGVATCFFDYFVNSIDRGDELNEFLLLNL